MSPRRLPKHSTLQSSAQHESKHSHTLGCQLESANSVCSHNHTCLPLGGQSFLLSNCVWNAVSLSGQPPIAGFLTRIRRRAKSLHLIPKPHLIPFYPSLATHRGKKILLSMLRILFPILRGLFFHFCLEQLIFHEPGLSARGPFCASQSHKCK